MCTTIFIVEDESMAIKYLRMLIDECGDEYQVVGEAYNGARALPEISRLKPDVVFADICMPIMDGLKMSETLLREKNPPIVFLLSSYKDFEYAQKGIKAGVRDYILKNELSADFLKDLLEKTKNEVESEDRNRHILLEHNVKHFLNAKSASQDYMLYKTKPLQRYVLMSLICDKPITLEKDVIQNEIDVDCYEMNKVQMPEGLLCSAFVEMSQGEYVAIIFIQSQCRDEKTQLGYLANTFLEKMKKYGFKGKVLISNIISNFADLSTLYSKSKKNVDYIYGIDKNVVWSDEISADVEKSINVESLLEECKLGLENNSKEQTLESFNKCKQLLGKLPYGAYIQLLRNIYLIIKEDAIKNRIDIESVETPKIYSSFSALVKMLELIITKRFDNIDLGVEIKSDYVFTAIEYIKKNYMKNISICDIADGVGISEGHLRRCFKQEMNVKIVNYLMEYRINVAKKMMKSRTKSLDEIWRESGFTSAQYFSYAFKQQEGITPREYMKNANKKW